MQKKTAKDYLIKVLIIIYSLFLLCLCFAFVLYFNISNKKLELAIYYEAIYITLYISGICVLAFLMFCIRRSNNCSVEPNEDVKHEENKTDTIIITSITNITHFHYSLTGEGFNIYILLGLAIFLLGSISYNIVRIIGEFYNNKICYNFGQLFFSVTQMAYFIFQAVFLFVYHKIIFINGNNGTRFFLVHLFLINICSWMHSVIGEIVEAVAHIELSKNNTKTSLEGSCLTNWLTDAVRPYLIPVIIEYSLLCGPMMLEILERVNHSNTNFPITKDLAADSFNDTKKFPLFHKSKRGLIFSAVVVASAIVVMLVFYLVDNVFVGPLIYHIIDIILNLCGIISLFLSAVHLRTLDYVNYGKVSFNDRVLIMCLTGTYVYCIVNCVSCIDTLRTKNLTLQMFALISMESAAHLLTIIECTVQTLVLLDGLRRRIASGYHVVKKPGRPYVVILLGINLTLWIFDTFEVKKINLLYSNELNGNIIAWTILQNITLPMMIFFRYHSTALFSIIWHKAYDKED